MIVQTRNAVSGGNGNITVSANIAPALAAGQAATLRLLAQGNIVITSTIAPAAGSLAVDLQAGTAAGGATGGQVASTINLTGGTVNTGTSGNFTAVSRGTIT